VGWEIEIPTVILTKAQVFCAIMANIPEDLTLNIWWLFSDFQSNHFDNTMASKVHWRVSHPF